MNLDLNIYKDIYIILHLYIIYIYIEYVSHIFIHVPPLLEGTCRLGKQGQSWKVTAWEGTTCVV